MRKLIPFILIFCMLTGCVKQSDYDALMQENAELTAQVAELTQQKDTLTQLQKANEPEKTIKARIVGGMTATVRALYPSYVLDDTTLMFAVVTPYQGMPLIIRLNDSVISTVEVGRTYHFALQSTSSVAFSISKEQLLQRYAPIPSGYEYQSCIFDSVEVPNLEDSGVNGIQFFWEELTQQKDELTQSLKANEPEKTIKARIVGGFSGVVNGVVGNWMNGHSDEMGYRYYVTVTPYQAEPVLIRVVSAEPMDIAVGTMYFFSLKMDDTLGIINEPLEIAQESKKPHAPFPPSEYWFDTVKTPLGGEDSGVNGIQFFWEKVTD